MCTYIDQLLVIISRDCDAQRFFLVDARHVGYFALVWKFQRAFADDGELINHRIWWLLEGLRRIADVNAQLALE